MVLNWANVITSGENTQDTTPEVMTVTSVTSTLVSLRPTNIYAATIFKVIDGTAILPFGSWEFDRETQIIRLDSPLSGANVPVTVVYSPGAPYTKTYLEAQPLLDSITLLNEGTPPIPKQQTTDASPEVMFGGQFNDPNDVLNTDPDFVLNDPYRYLEDVDDPEALYECMEFCEIDNGGSTGLLSSICDDSYCGSGWLDFQLSGGVFSESFPKCSDGFGGNSPGGPSAPSGFSPFAILHASGGAFVDGTIGSTIIYPNYPSAGVQFGTGGGGVQQPLKIGMTLTGVMIDGIGTEADLEDDASLADTADNTPPSFSTDPDLVPDGTPGTNLHGAVLGVLETFGDYSRVGPWAGLPDLEPESLVAGVSASQPTGIPSSGMAFTFVGGAALPGSSFTVHNIEAAN
jgi:hypothetical protein